LVTFVLNLRVLCGKKNNEPQRTQRRHKEHKEGVYRKTLGDLCVKPSCALWLKNHP
jgi:hypothetical protein